MKEAKRRSDYQPSKYKITDVNLPEGLTYDICVFAIDEAGNITQTPIDTPISRDTVAPVINVVIRDVESVTFYPGADNKYFAVKDCYSGEGNGNKINKLSIYVEIDEAASGVEYFNFGKDISVQESTTLSIVKNGTNIPLERASSSFNIESFTDYDAAPDGNHPQYLVDVANNKIHFLNPKSSY